MGGPSNEKRVLGVSYEKILAYDKYMGECKQHDYKLEPALPFRSNGRLAL